MTTSTEQLTKLIAAAETHLQNLNYSSKTIQRYKSVWKKVLLHPACVGLADRKGDSYLPIASGLYENIQNEPRTPGNVFRMRAIVLLNEIYNNHKPKRCYKDTGKQVESCYAELLGLYLDEQTAAGLVQRTVKAKSIQMTRFLNYLHGHSLSNIKFLRAEHILSYVASLHGQYVRNSISGILFTLRNFLLYIYEKGLTSKPFYELFPVIYSNKEDKLPSFYYEDELKKVLYAIDRDTVIGKRDYLILILAMQLGIRASDIRTLQFSDFHWDKNTIEFVQIKTGNPISLPLPENIKYAWIDYIKNSRPPSASPYIFIRHCAPYEPYGAGNVFYYSMTRYLKAAGIDCVGRKQGLHAMRHSLASNLLRNNTPFPVITGILGHESSSSTEVYLSINVEELRSVALEVPDER